jgi:hypothetical protein
MNDTAGPLCVRVHIDRERYESVSPTTGAALYALASIPEHRELFRELSGDREDELVHRDGTHIHLTEDEHFYSQKDFNIYVNTETKEVAKRRLSFEDLVKLAFEHPPTGPNIHITIEFGNGPPQNPSGDLLKGQTVVICDGMVFDVVATDRS